MSNVFNLREARKRKKRADAERMAARNRATFGQTKQAKDAARDAEARRARLLDGAKREIEDSKADTPYPDGAPDIADHSE